MFAGLSKHLPCSERMCFSETPLHTPLPQIPTRSTRTWSGGRRGRVQSGRGQRQCLGVRSGLAPCQAWTHQGFIPNTNPVRPTGSSLPSSRESGAGKRSAHGPRVPTLASFQPRGPSPHTFSLWGSSVCQSDPQPSSSLGWALPSKGTPLALSQAPDLCWTRSYHSRDHMSSPDSFLRPEGPASILRGSGSRADIGEAELGGREVPKHGSNFSQERPSGSKGSGVRDANL